MKRLLAMPEEVLYCPSCPPDPISRCALANYVCQSLRDAKQHGLRIYLWGQSGFGKTRAVNSHFSEIRTFIPYCDKTFGFDGFEADLHSAIFFDEFKVSSIVSV